MAYTLVDTPDAILSMLGSLGNLPSTPPSLYVDIEGVNLCRDGSVSIVQIFVLPLNHTYLVDIHVLQSEAFSTANDDGLSLKTILESGEIPKVFFDVRNDSDALYSHFKIDLKGIQDVQLMELATRSFPKRLVSGLDKCIEKDIVLGTSERLLWLRTKAQGKNLFLPQNGGSFEVFNTRPMSPVIVDYCVQDVTLLPKLWATYKAKMSPSWAAKVDSATKDRVVQSHSASYIPKGRHMALSPW